MASKPARAMLLVDAIFVVLTERLPPAATRGARFPAPAPLPRLPDAPQPWRGRFRYPSLRPALAPEPGCEPRSAHWYEPAAPPAAGLPAPETLRPAPRAISARTPRCAPRLRQYRHATSPPRPRSCCAAPRVRAAMACARARYRARTATPAESPSAPLRAVIPLVVEASHPCGADIDRKMRAMKTVKSNVRLSLLSTRRKGF